MEEIWKDIEWHKGSYKVSNMGRVDILLHPKNSKLVYYDNVKIKILQ